MLYSRLTELEAFLRENVDNDDADMVAEAKAEIERLWAIETDLRSALAFVKAERDHWHGLVPRADRAQFPFDIKAASELPSKD